MIPTDNLVFCLWPTHIRLRFVRVPVKSAVKDHLRKMRRLFGEEEDGFDASRRFARSSPPPLANSEQKQEELKPDTDADEATGKKGGQVPNVQGNLSLIFVFNYEY